MKRNTITAVIAILFIALLAYVGAAKLLDYYYFKKQMNATAFRKPEKTGLEGKLVPSFSLLLADSTTYFNTNNIPEGQPVVLFYFSPECPRCQEQMEEINRSFDLLKEIRFYVFTPYPFGEMKKFYERYRLKKHPNIIVGVDYMNFFGGYFKTTSVPYIAIYGKDKRLKEAFVGSIYSPQIKAVTEK